jgi:hypothetical protein
MKTQPASWTTAAASFFLPRLGVSFQVRRFAFRFAGSQVRFQIRRFAGSRDLRLLSRNTHIYIYVYIESERQLA